MNDYRQDALSFLREKKKDGQAVYPGDLWLYLVLEKGYVALSWEEVSELIAYLLKEGIVCLKNSQSKNGRFRTEKISLA